MAFRFRQFFHQIDHVSLVDERGELNGEASLVQIHIIKFRRLEPVHEVLPDQMLTIGEEVFLSFPSDPCHDVRHRFHAFYVSCP